MIRKTCILLVAVSMSIAPALAQYGGGGNGASFAPKSGQWQVNAVIGNNTMFSQSEGMNYLLPTYYDGEEFTEDTGLGTVEGKENQSEDPGMYLNIGEVGSNSLMNLVGLQVKCFVSDRLDVNVMFSMNINTTPSKNYVEGDYTVTEMPVQGSKYVEGRLSNTWMVNGGANYYFTTKNERICVYLGIRGGWQQGRLTATLPDYTGEYVYDSTTGEETEVQVYTPYTRKGQICGLNAGLVAGIEYSLASGLIFGFEVEPGVYRYDKISIIPTDQATYEVDNHRVNIFSTPCLKIGFRF